jgi:hypothetical protein
MAARLIALATGVAMAAIASQAPEFVQQYRQRLGGAIDELAGVLRTFDADADRLGLGRDGALTRLDEAADPVARQRAVRLREMTVRLASLRDQQRAMANSGAFRRLAVFATDIDTALAGRTAGDFEPAMPLTLEGAATAAGGFGLGYGLIRLAGRLRRKRVRRPARER